MSDINLTTLTGRLVRPPIVKRGEGGRLFGMFTLASNQRYTDKNGAQQEETAFVTCKVFGGWAEPLNGHTKGDMAVVTGRLKTESWAQDGETRQALMLVCETLHFLAGKTPPGAASLNAREPAASLVSRSEVPF